jgi:hypothetical protein
MLLAGVAVGALAVAWVWSRTSEDRVVVDLVEALATAKERRPSAESQAVVDATISGVSRRAILVKEAGRIKYELTLPENAWLKLGVAMAEESWSMPGDGVVIYLYVTPLGDDGQPTFDADGNLRTEELLSLAVNPHANEADRTWHDLTLDLSTYAGRRVELVFVTRASPPANPPRHDTTGDLLLWGAPRIVVN